MPDDRPQPQSQTEPELESHDPTQSDENEAHPAEQIAAQDAHPPEDPIESAEVIEPENAEEDPTAADPELESAGEMEEAPAEIIDADLGALLQTPVGLRGAIEALLFSSPEPLTLRRMGNVLEVRDFRLIQATVQQLQNEYDTQRRGIQIIETSGGYRMATRELFGDLILRLKGRKRRPTLSQAALETLAIVAYRQPIIRAEVEAVRGVESSGTLRNLIDMGLVEMVGRKDVLGRPPMYGTTEQFLQSFGLKDIQELPSISELKRQLKEREDESEQREREAAEQRRAEQPEAESETEAEQTATALAEGPESEEERLDRLEDEVEETEDVDSALLDESEFNKDAEDQSEQDDEAEADEDEELEGDEPDDDELDDEDDWEEDEFDDEDDEADDEEDEDRD